MPELRQKISLRFENPSTEAHFVKIHSANLLENLFWLAVLCLLTLTCVLVYVATHPPAAPELPGVGMSRVLVVTSDVSCLLVAMLTAIATKCPSFNRSVSPEMKEIMAVLVIMFFSFMAFLIDLFYGPKLLRYDPVALWAPGSNFSDTRPVLALSVLMTASHLTLPIRWIVLLPLEAFSVMVYAAFAFILGGPDGLEAWSTLVLYIALVLCSAIGRRTIENHERDSLSLLILERSLRAETEFRLTEMEESSQAPATRHRPDDQLSTRESRPETTASSQAFARASEGSGFQEVIEIGKHEQWLIDPEAVDLMEDQVLGHGSFGKVVVGCYAGTLVAVKTMPGGSDQVPEKRHFLISILNEVRILRRLRHPNIVMFFGSCLLGEDGNALLIMEWVRGPCLESFVLQGGVPDRPIVLTDQLRAIKDICFAVCHLHSRRPSIVHGDLKGTNIIMERDPSLTNSFRAKLLDFGLARVLTRHVGRMGGTTMWVAPELVVNPSSPANESADVFSFGRVSFFVLTGIFPFPRCLQKQQILEILSSGSLPPLPWPRASSSLVAEWRPWVEACSVCDPMSRPSMDRNRLHILQSSHRFGLEAAPAMPGFLQAAQQDEDDRGDAETPPSSRNIPPGAPTGSPIAQDSTDLAFLTSEVATVMSL